MKRFQVVVNGNSYEVEVEELAAGASARPVAVNPAPVVAPIPVVAPATAPVVAAAPAAQVAPAAVPTGAAKVSSPMPGKIVSVNVTVGQSIKAGDIICILEAMKMENEIFASESGTVASVNVNAGDAVETGDVIVTIN